MAKNFKILAEAASTGDVKTLRQLLGKGVSVDVEYEGASLLHHGVRAKYLSVIRYFVEQGAALNLLDCDDLTPLMTACSLGGNKGSAIALELIAKGCDINIRRDDGMSALEFAVKNCEPEVVEKLLDLGAEIDGPVRRKQTPAMLATRSSNKKTLQVLIERGADLSLECQLPWAKGLDCLGIAKLEKRPSMVKFLQMYI